MHVCTKNNALYLRGKQSTLRKVRGNIIHLKPQKTNALTINDLPYQGIITFARGG